MERPFGHTVVCVILLSAAIGGYFSYFGDVPRGWFIDIAAFCSVLILVAIIIAFWFGSNFARWLLILSAGYTWLRLGILWMDPPPIDQAVIIVEACLAVPLMFWLFTPRVVAFTSRSNHRVQLTGTPRE